MMKLGGRGFGEIVGSPVARAWAIATSVIILSAVSGFALGGRADNAPSAAGAERWALPVWSKPEVQQDFERVLHSEPFGKSAKPPGAEAQSGAPTGANDPKLKFSGVITGAGQNLLVLTGPPGAKSDYLKVGDKMPDGAEIKDIEPTEAKVERGTSAEQLRLFRRK